MAALRALFDNPQVAGAVNPSAFGYHHGPIPNNNPDWTPPRQAIAIANGVTPVPSVTVNDNANPPNLASNLSGVSTMVCEIEVNGPMRCGQVFSARPTERRHCRDRHPGALTNPNTNNVTMPARIAGENAIKLFVLSGGWRNAIYLNEPGRGPPGGYLDTYATQCEAIAAADPQFAAQFGTRFHRDDNPNVKRRRQGKCPAYADRALGPLSETAANARALATAAEQLLNKTAPAEHMPTPQQQLQPPTPGSGKRNRGPDPPPDKSPPSTSSGRGNKEPASKKPKTRATGTRGSARLRGLAAS